MKTNYIFKKWLFDCKVLFSLSFLFFAGSSFGQVVADFEIESSLCCGSSLEDLVIINTSTSGSGDLTYKWSYMYMNGVDLGDDSLFCDSIYSIKLVAATANGEKDSITKNFRVKEEVDASFIPNKNGRTVSPTPLQSGNDQYRWTFGDGGKSSAENPTYTYVNIDGGTFVICLATRRGDCWAETCNEIGFAGNVDELIYFKNVITYPNPSTGIFTIDADGVVIHAMQLQDVTGKSTMELKWKMESNSATIDISDKPSGIYFLRLISDGLVGTKRIVVTR
jgi:hypothetical protein